MHMQASKEASKKFFIIQETTCHKREEARKREKEGIRIRSGREDREQGISVVKKREKVPGGWWPHGMRP
jgi:hypothetical protein